MDPLFSQLWEWKYHNITYKKLHKTSHLEFSLMVSIWFLIFHHHHPHQITIVKSQSSWLAWLEGFSSTNKSMDPLFSQLWEWKVSQYRLQNLIRPLIWNFLLWLLIFHHRPRVARSQIFSFSCPYKCSREKG